MENDERQNQTVETDIRAQINERERQLKEVEERYAEISKEIEVLEETLAREEKLYNNNIEIFKRSESFIEKLRGREKKDALEMLKFTAESNAELAEDITKRRTMLEKLKKYLEDSFEVLKSEQEEIEYLKKEVENFNELESKEKELTSLEAEEETISVAEALMDKQTVKDGQDIGEE